MTPEQEDEATWTVNCIRTKKNGQSTQNNLIVDVS